MEIPSVEIFPRLVSKNEKSYDFPSLASAFLPPPPHFPFRIRSLEFRPFPSPLPGSSFISTRGIDDPREQVRGNSLSISFSRPRLLTRHTAPFYVILCNTTNRTWKRSGSGDLARRRKRTTRGNRNFEERRGLISCPAKKCEFPSNYVIYKYQRGDRFSIDR